MARALIVGCGCRGRDLGKELLGRGWQVRGTTRKSDVLGAIESAGIEAVVADPDRIATVIDQLEGVAIVYWLLATAAGEPGSVAALHGPRLQRLLEEIVDTPVRGFVYELPVGLDPGDAIRALEILRQAGEAWRIPYEVVDAGPDDHDSWRQGMIAAAEELIGGPAGG